MIMKSQNSRVVFTAALFGSFLIPNLFANANSEESSIYQYQNAEGENYYAVGLKVSDKSVMKKVNKTFIIMDTSASQVGAHRDEALSILKNVLKQLPENHTVKISVLDVELTELQKSFENSQSDSVKAALNAIENRSPLGTTNLFKGLNKVASILKNETNVSVLYIGDGMSISDFFQKEDVASVSEKFRAQKLAIHSYAVGPNVDYEMLGIFAQQTGGTIYISSENDQATSKKILRSISLSPIYLSKFHQDKFQLNIKPASVLPLRTDRNTYFLVKGTMPKTISSSAGNVNFNWDISPSNFKDGNASLMHCWNRANNTDDLSLAMAGNDLLKMRIEDFSNYVTQLEESGEYALQIKENKQAESIAKQLKQVDPTNKNVKFLLASSQKTVKKVDDKTIKKEVVPKKKSGNSRLEAELRKREVRGQILTKVTEEVIANANKISSLEPESAVSSIKTAIATVTSSTDITPELREKLHKRLLKARQNILNQNEVNQLKLARFHERMSQREAVRSIRKRVRAREEETEQLVERVRALIIEGYHGNDEAFEDAEEVARTLVDLNPGSGPSVQTLFVSEAAGQLNKSFRLRTLRADRFLATLHQVELSHVPFPDEPPVRWPTPEFWDHITKVRKKWKRFDVFGTSKTENRIREKLDETIVLDFVDSTLIDVIEYIKDLKQIPIKIALEKIVDEGDVDPEEGNISFSQSGIKLKSALNQILGDLNLTYIIDNEILTITTTAAAAENPPPPRIYYVGYFNEIVQQQQGGGGFGGGQGGQQGGGQGGFGGNQGGGQGGFSVPGKFMMKHKKGIQQQKDKNSLKNFLKNKTSSVNDTRGQAFAQVQGSRFILEKSKAETIKKKQHFGM